MISWHRLFGGALLFVVCACSRPRNGELLVALGPSVQKQFVPKSAFAEYFELAGAPDQLRVTLASYTTDCDHWTPPPPGEVMVSLIFEIAPGRPLALGDYARPAAAGAPTALPFVRTSERGRVLPANGKATLAQLERGLHGQVRGQLDFRTVTEGETAVLAGPFAARICRAVLDESRATAQEQ
jgi:hypothetical protein